MISLAAGTALKLVLASTPHTGSGQPAVGPDVEMSVAYTESALDPLAIHDNATGSIFHPATKGALADRRMTAGHLITLAIGTSAMAAALHAMRCVAAHVRRQGP
jgi:hypothetical protein